ncbi:MAG: hypothetical protein OXD36_07565 [Rhodobacter sp.]|nr:hypothetical protein [Rhodobacter sp.]
MRTLKLMLPAVTVAGALALAGCGGGSDTPTRQDDGKVACPAPNAKLFVDDRKDCPGPAASGTPLTGDALADAEALQTGLEGFTTTVADLNRASGNPLVDGDDPIIETSAGKLGTPAEDDDDPWKTSAVAPAVGGGWTVKGYERTKDDGEENLVSYSSGEQSIDQSLMDWTEEDAQSDIALSGKVLTFTAGTFNADFFPAGFHRQDLDDDDELKGTFIGLDGTFKCTENACAASRNETDDAATVTLAGNWIFTVDGNAARLKVPAKYAEMSNPEFLTFGYWWRETVGSDDKPSIEVDAFVNSGGILTTLPGGTDSDADPPISASYSGKASGAYVREVLDGGKKVPAAAGLFTADVTLNAVFTGDTGSTVSGSIHDFKDGTTQISDWKLALGGSVLTETGGFDGKAGAEGTYRGSFYGEDGDDAPSGAAGVFDSGTTFANGQAAGAFGATVDED